MTKIILILCCIFCACSIRPHYRTDSKVEQFRRELRQTLKKNRAEFERLYATEIEALYRAGNKL